jgi:hypothetical protein
MNYEPPGYPRREEFSSYANLLAIEFDHDLQDDDDVQDDDNQDQHYQDQHNQDQHHQDFVDVDELLETLTEMFDSPSDLEYKGFSNIVCDRILLLEKIYLLNLTTKSN